jgi:hypothetical protein
MKRGRFDVSGVSVVLLLFQLLVVSSVAGKYLWQRWRCPRVWTRAAAIDPHSAHARPLPLASAHRRRLPKHAALGQTGNFSARRQRRHQARPVCSPPAASPVPRQPESREQPARRRAPRRSTSAARRTQTAGQEISAMPERALRPDAALTDGVDFYIADTAKSPLPVRPGQELVDRGDRPAHRPAAPDPARAQRQRTVPGSR